MNRKQQDKLEAIRKLLVQADLIDLVEFGPVIGRGYGFDQELLKRTSNLLIMEDPDAVGRPNQPFFGFLNEEMFEQICALACSTTNPDERVLEEKAMVKWNQPQGGRQNLTRVLAGVKNYVGDDSSDDPLPEWRSDARLPVLPHVEHPVLSTSTDLYHTYSGNHRSSGGITWMADRRNHRHDAVRNAWLDPLWPDPIICGSRYKDTKVRNIFMDTLENQFRLARILDPLFQAWRSTPCNHAASDESLEDKIMLTAASAHGNVVAYGGDYSAMDQHMGLQSCVRAIRLLGKMAGTSEQEMQTVIKDFTDIWDRMSLVVGTYELKLRYGHKLLSGLYCTHDLESPFNYSILNETCSRMGIYPDTTWADPYWQARILVNGDDSIVLFNLEILHCESPADLIQRFAATHSQVASEVGQVMNADKVEWSTSYAPFCKRYYYFTHVKGVTMSSRLAAGRAVPRSKYSLIKAWNGVFHPEHLPKFTSDWAYAVWFCTLLDCASGMTKWQNSLQTFVSLALKHDPSLLQDFIDPCEPNEADIAELCRDPWLAMVLGDELTRDPQHVLKCSPTWATLRSRLTTSAD